MPDETNSVKPEVDAVTADSSTSKSATTVNPDVEVVDGSEVATPVAEPIADPSNAPEAPEADPAEEGHKQTEHEGQGFVVQHEDGNVLGESMERGVTFFDPKEGKAFIYSSQEDAEESMSNVENCSVQPVHYKLVIG